MAEPVVDVKPNNIIERGLRYIPGGQRTKVWVGTTLALGFLAATFFGGKAKKSGHGAFDVEKPQKVQEEQDRAETNRLNRFVSSQEKKN